MRRLRLTYLNIAELRVDPKNRELFDALDPHEIDFLAESIKQHGLINPITITEEYLIIAGEQRYRAAKQLGLEQVPVIIRKPKDSLELEEIRIDENLLRRTLPTYTLAKALKRKTEIKLERLSIEDSPLSTQLQGKLDSELVVETGYSRKHIQETRSLGNLVPELGELLNENKFSRDVGLHLAQLSESDQRWVLNRLSASRLKEIKTEEVKQLKTDLHKLQKLVEARDNETDKQIKAEAAAEVAKAKREANEFIAEIRAQYEIRTKELDRKYHEDQRQPITRFLYKAVSLLHTDPQVTANNFHLVSFDLGEMVCDKAEALSPWLIAFAKALRQRIRQERRPTLKEVR